MDRINIKDSLFGLVKALRYSLFNIIIFEILYKLLIYFIFKPIINFIITFFIAISGKPIIINNDIFIFLKSTPGILMIISLLLIGILIIYYEFAVIIGFLQAGYLKKKVNFKYGLKYGLYASKSLFHLSSIFFSLYLLVIIPYLNFGISSSLIPNLSIPAYITGEIAKYEGFYKILIYSGLTLILLLFIYLFIKLIFLLPSMIIKKQSFFKAAKESFNLIKHNLIRVIIIFLITIIFWLSLIFIVDNLILNESFLISKLSLIILMILKIITSPLCLGIIFSIYTNKVGIIDVDNEKLDMVGIKVKKVYDESLSIGKRLLVKIIDLFNNKKTKYIVYILLIIPIVYVFILTLNMFMMPKEKETFIIGHRGSKKGVENTIEAVNNAINMGADYVEIDVMLSKDNIPIVIHDSNLRRLTGKNKQVYNYTAKELKSFTLKQNGYEGSIAFLDEICKLAKGRIKLLIEFKTHGKEKESLIDEVVKTVKRNKMDKSVLYHTTEYNILLEMKVKYPNEKIGYVIVSKIGNITKHELNSIDADFYNISEEYVSEKLVKSIQNMNKKIFVWTINNEDKLDELIKMGVDGIVTDEIDLALGIRDL